MDSPPEGGAGVAVTTAAMKQLMMAESFIVATISIRNLFGLGRVYRVEIWGFSAGGRGSLAAC